MSVAGMGRVHGGAGRGGLDVATDSLRKKKSPALGRARGGGWGPPSHPPGGSSRLSPHLAPTEAPFLQISLQRPLQAALCLAEEAPCLSWAFRPVSVVAVTEGYDPSCRPVPSGEPRDRDCVALGAVAPLWCRHHIRPPC